MEFLNDILIVVVPAIIGSLSALLTKKLDLKYYPNSEMILKRTSTLILLAQVYFDFHKAEFIDLPTKVNDNKLEKKDILIRLDIECDTLIMYVSNKKVRRAIIQFKKNKSESNFNNLNTLLGKHYGI